MRKLSMLVVGFLLLNALPSLGATGEGEVEAQADVDSPSDGPGAGYTCPTPDDLNRIDRECSANDVCTGAESWPIETTGTSSGNVGGEHDPADWSRVEMYRNEKLAPTSSTQGILVEQGGLTCTPSDITKLYAEENGWYTLRVSADAHAPYTVRYDIVTNDADSGKDVGNTVADAWYINALPKSLNPTHSAIIYKGSIPNRKDQLLGPDQDWYRIGSSLAFVPDPTQTKGPAAGLLTVEVEVDCNGGDYLFGFYEEDGLTPIGTSAEGCGLMPKSCVTTGATPVHAQIAVTGGRGTGYDFTAELVPLYLVDLGDGVPRPYLTPEEPWCDSLVQTVLEKAGSFEPGTDVGLVNSEGVVVATFQAR